MDASSDPAETPLEIAEFIDEPSTAASSRQVENVDTIHGEGAQRVLPPGPDVPEAMGWWFGFFFAHLAGSIVAAVVAVVVAIANGVSPHAMNDLNAWPGYAVVIMLGGDQLLLCIMAMIAAVLRWWGRWWEPLNLSAPRLLHVMIVCAMMLPLSVVSSELYRVLLEGWKPIVEAQPWLGILDEMNAVEMLAKLAQAGSLPIMILIIAGGPALGEELVFRGVIGRGLVARRGVIWGVLLSSALFASAHIHPVHAAAVFPMGIVLHFVYLTTRSFWMPMLLHFLNNAFATMMSQVAQNNPAMAAAEHEPANPLILVTSLAALGALGWLLYRTRRIYVLADGSEWAPGYSTAEYPPRELELQVTVQSQPLCLRSLATASVAWVVCIGLIAYEFTRVAGE